MFSRLSFSTESFSSTSLRFTPAPDDGEEQPPGTLTPDPVSTTRQYRRSINVRALIYALDGPERPYVVYPFGLGRRNKIERPGHNPFAAED